MNNPVHLEPFQICVEGSGKRKEPTTIGEILNMMIPNNRVEKSMIIVNHAFEIRSRQKLIIIITLVPRPPDIPLITILNKPFNVIK